MRTNAPAQGPRTAEGAPSHHVTPEEQLRRAVSACLLWEDGFYENGQNVTDRIVGLMRASDPDVVVNIMLHAKERQHLRHVPLLMATEITKYPSRYNNIASLVSRVIKRADEIAEFVSLYWRGGKRPLSKQAKRGLGWSFKKFDEYQLAKYNRDDAVKMKDVMRLVHPKADNPEQSALWGRLLKDELKVPDTWEVALSSGITPDMTEAQRKVYKRETWIRLLSDGKLGYLALLRNLRNMIDVGVPDSIVKEAILARRGAQRVLPFRFIAAARHAPRFERELDIAMQGALMTHEKLPGTTLLLVDVSQSMQAVVSSKSELSRRDAAAALAILLAGVCENIRIVTFSSRAVEVPPRTGMALVDAIRSSQRELSTHLVAAMNSLSDHQTGDVCRTIVITDEQSNDGILPPWGKGYVLNVATDKNGIGYGSWTHVHGWSESVVDYILEVERSSAASIR